MKGLLDFLRSHPVAWMLPILVFLLLVLFVAWRMLQAPESPFVYREF